MKLTKKQRIISITVFLPIFLFGLILKLIRDTCELICYILQLIVTKLWKFDRVLSKKYENFIKKV